MSMPQNINSIAANTIFLQLKEDMWLKCNFIKSKVLKFWNISIRQKKYLTQNWRWISVPMIILITRKFSCIIFNGDSFLFNFPLCIICSCVLYSAVFIFSCFLFSAVFYFQLGSIFCFVLFLAVFYFQPYFIFSCVLFSAVFYFQLYSIFSCILLSAVFYFQL